MKKLLPVVLLGIVAGCNSFLDVDTNEDGKLAQGLALWESAGLMNYDFTITNICVCSISPRVAVVQVRDGEIVGIIDDSTGELANEPVGIQSIPDLFALIQSAIDTPANLLWVAYHFRYGFPTQIELDPDGRTPNDEIRIRVGRFRVVTVQEE